MPKASTVTHLRWSTPCGERCKRGHTLGVRADMHPLLRPWVVASVFVLILNDHLFKAAYPGFVTGKLSDFAGLLFFPYLLHALWTAIAPKRASLMGCVVATGVVFTAIQLLPVAGSTWCWMLGALQWIGWSVFALLAGDALPSLVPVTHTADPTDLLALPMLGFAVRDARGGR